MLDYHDYHERLVRFDDTIEATRIRDRLLSKIRSFCSRLVDEEAKTQRWSLDQRTAMAELLYSEMSYHGRLFEPEEQRDLSDQNREEPAPF